MPKLPERATFYLESIAKSYAQIFFSDQVGLGAMVLLVSFIDPYAGASGLFAVFSTITMASVIGLNPTITRSGTYSYNTLMVGLVMGIYFQFNIAFFLVLFLACFITLLLTVWIAIKLAAYKLPFLSLPFIVGVWIVLLSSRSLGAIQLSERGVYELNDLWTIGGPALVNAYEKINSWEIPFAFDIFLKSMGAIIFQPNVVVGFLVTVGLLVYSRISFTLSLIGFYSGYLFCNYVQGNVAQLNSSYIGFNFILTAVALGGFFVVPSGRSYLLVAFAMPIVSLIIGSLDTLMYAYQLPLFSLPFSLVVMGIMFTLLNRFEAKGLSLVGNQQFSPEKNLYSFRNSAERYKNDTYYHIQLPFYGAWRVSQGHAGGITHKGDWSDALDFDIADETGKTYRLPGKKISDFYCYGLPVLAPAAGYITTLINEVEDNEIGEVNIDRNWGNTIIIKHGEFLYSKLSHIKKESFKVKLGDYVLKGDVLAMCGNSGRSPEPHIHFQLQTTPHVGSKTLLHPISYFISQRNDQKFFHAFEIPAEGQTIFNPLPNASIKNAFGFIPGLKMEWEVDMNGAKRQLSWEVLVDAYNLPYIFCHSTQSVAYFVNNGTLHYFTRFYGDRTSLLYLFYLGAYKVLMSYYSEVLIKDSFAIDNFYSGSIKYFHDFIAPFYHYLDARYESYSTDGNDQTDPTSSKLKSSASVWIGRREIRRTECEFQIENDMLTSFMFTEKNLCTKARRLV